MSSDDSETQTGDVTNQHDWDEQDVDEEEEDETYSR